MQQMAGINHGFPNFQTFPSIQKTCSLGCHGTKDWESTFVHTDNKGVFWASGISRKIIALGEWSDMLGSLCDLTQATSSSEHISLWEIDGQGILIRTIILLWCLFQTIVDDLDLFSIFTTLNENKIFIHIITYNCLLKYFSNYESLREKFSKEHLEETD